MSKVPTGFLRLLPAWKAAFVPDGIKNFSFQKIQYWKPTDKQYGFIPENRAPNDADWAHHFITGPYHDDNKNEYVGSIAFIGCSAEKKIKWICFDLDDAELVARATEKVIPYLNNLNVEWIMEFSGDNNDRIHLWIMCDNVDVKVAEDWIRQVLAETDTTFPEIYPLRKKKANVIRTPFGPHIRRQDTRYPVENSKGERGEGWEDGIPIFTKAKRLTNQWLLANTKAEYMSEKEYKYKPSGPYFYEPRKLETALPLEEIPQGMRKLFRNCQAAQWLLKETVNTKRGQLFLDDSNGTGHDAMLTWTNICIYHDAINSRRGEKGGRKFLNDILSKYRSKPVDSHNLDYHYREALDQPHKYFPSCESWDQTFAEKCNGCPFRGSIGSPRKFVSSKMALPITRTVVQDFKLKTIEEIRATTLTDFKNHVGNLLDTGGSENMLIAVPQQGGKTYSVCEIIAANPDKRFLVLVPTSRMAKEYRRMLRSMGVKAYALMSHENLFRRRIADFDCPSEKKIKDKLELGLGSSAVARKVCQKCPYANRCPWPNQYAKAQEPGRNAIIIQHAHLGTQEVMFELLSKKFDAMFIDESFIENCFKFIKPSPRQLEQLDACRDMKWADKLYEWLSKGGIPRDSIYPKEDELRKARTLFQNSGLGWPVPEWIRSYNMGRYVNDEIGIEIVNELPKVPITVFTDATPPVRLIERMTGIKDLKVYGQEDVINVKAIHPGNEIIQVLDSSVSKSNLNKDELFYEILAKVGYLVKYRWQGQQTLLTVYKGWEELAKEFFSKPEWKGVLDILSMNNMDRGTNKYAAYDNQILVAGVYFNGNQYYETMYRYKTTANYHLQRDNKPIFNNPYPYDVIDSGKMVSVPIRATPIQRIEYDGSGGGVIAEYSDFNYWVPCEEEWFEDIEEFNRGAFQQAMRLRFSPDKPRRAILMGNMPTKFAINRSMLMSTFLNTYDG